MAGCVYHPGILPGNTNNDHSVPMVVIYVIAAHSSLIMEANAYE